MSLLVFWTLIGASAVTVVALYLRRPRPRVLVVPFVGWFREARRAGVESRRALRLRQPLSLLLQLFLLGLLAFLGARFLPRDESRVERVVLLDTTGALDAVDARGVTVRKRLEEGLVDLLERFAKEDQVTVLDFAETPRVLARGRATDRALLRFEWPEEGNSGAPNVEEALSLATAIAGERAEVVLLRAPGGGVSLEALRSRGVREFRAKIDVRPRDVPRLESFGARRVPSDPSVVDATLVVDGSGREERELELEVAAVRSPEETPRVLFHERRRVRFPAEIFAADLLASETALLATVRFVGAPEPLTPAQLGYATVAELPPLRVFVRGESSTFLAAALLQDSRFVRVDREASADVEIVTTGGATREAGRAVPTLYLGAEAPLGTAGTLANFGFDAWSAEHPVFASLDPYEIQILRGVALAAEKEDLVLARTGKQPILVAGRRLGSEFLALGFVPEDSDFVLRPAYPLFIHNALLFLGGRKLGGPNPTALAGEPVRVDFGENDSRPARIFGPWPGERARERVRPSEGKTFVFVPEQQGFFTITRGESSKLVAVARRREAPSDASNDGQLPPFDGAPRALAPPWLFLAGTLLVFGSAFEWLGYQRRWTS